MNISITVTQKKLSELLFSRGCAFCFKKGHTGVKKQLIHGCIFSPKTTKATEISDFALYQY